MEEKLKLRHLVQRKFKFRSALTGRYVSRMYALFNPATTVAERIP